MTTFRKFIVTHEVETGGTRFGNGFIIPNHYCHSLASFKQMVREARKDFPDLQDDEVECRTVVRSSWCQNMPIIRFALPPDTAMAGWTDLDNRLRDVVWS